jgi:hypothetical protein
VHPRQPRGRWTGPLLRLTGVPTGSQLPPGRRLPLTALGRHLLLAKGPQWRIGQHFRCIARERVHLKPAEQATALIDERAGRCVNGPAEVVAKDVHSWRSRRAALDLKADARASTRASPRCHLSFVELGQERPSFSSAVLQHPGGECALGCSQRTVGSSRAHLLGSLPQSRPSPAAGYGRLLPFCRRHAMSAMQRRPAAQQAVSWSAYQAISQQAGVQEGLLWRGACGLRSASITSPCRAAGPGHWRGLDGPPMPDSLAKVDGPNLSPPSPLAEVVARATQPPDSPRQTPDARRQTPDARRQTPDARRHTPYATRQNPPPQIAEDRFFFIADP